jgi:hypothetical protein
MEPIGLAGLTIAVLDQLWKIGNGTAELISNYRDFDSVSVQRSERRTPTAEHGKGRQSAGKQDPRREQ